MEAIGITCPLWDWFKEYLSGRFHYVCLNNINSTTLYLTQRDLGVMAKHDLSWTEHHNIICKRAYYTSVNLIRRTMPPNSYKSLKKALYLF